MSTTPNLMLPLVAAQQAQKHVTLNEALARIDAVAQLAVVSASLATPPSAPQPGDRYIVPAGALGDWAGHGGKVAVWDVMGWMLLTPQPGWSSYVTDTAKIQTWNGAAWINQGEAALTNTAPQLARLGVGAPPDPVQPLVVAGASALFNHGGDHHRLAVNKAATANTASLVLQKSYAGHAEIGLIGDDNLSMKVSPDGTSWTTAFTIDRQTGRISMPQTPTPRLPGLLLNGDFQINQRGFGGGTLAAGTYGFDRWKAGTGPAALTLSGRLLTLTSGAIIQVVDPASWGLDGFGGMPVTVSLEGPSAPVAVTFGNASGTIPAGVGRQSVTLTSTAAPGPTALQLSPVAGATTFSRVKLEPGPVASEWLPVSATESLAACQSFFAKSYPPTIAPGTVTTLGQISHRDTGLNSLEKGFLNLRCPVPMRAAPNVTWYSPQTGQSARIWHLTGNLDRIVDQTVGASVVASGHPRLQTGIGDLNHFWLAQVTMDAEL